MIIGSYKKNMVEKKAVIIANWKMHKTSREADDFVRKLASHARSIPAQVMIAAPFTAIAAASMAASGTNVLIGAQNMSPFAEGPYTGEVSARMLREIGVRFVLLGHSERRRLFFETNETIRQKVERAVVEGIQPVLCIGETLEERESGKTGQVLTEQMRACLEGLSSEDLRTLVIAYEPIWAIGKVAATPEAAEAAHLDCRQFLQEKWGEETALQTPILYGGSVNPKNIKELLKQPNIDGALVGHASLDVETFVQLIKG
jgi:triosephosphate isomerase